MGLAVLAWGVAVGAGAASAASPTPEQCAAAYRGCDAACNTKDPRHGFSYAWCSAKCVASRATCEGEIIYDETSAWSKKQYDAAKPWVQEKTRQTKELIDEDPSNTEYKYLPNDPETCKVQR